ncbi:hypothetical protein FB451DRAFT_1418182 [Mycena latifolia]|nr:hypothetical protein FB451DRAFT_1418182 [Mycena latifolia]
MDPQVMLIRIRHRQDKAREDTALTEFGGDERNHEMLLFRNQERALATYYRHHPHVSAPRVKFHEVQVTLARQWIGNDSDGSSSDLEALRRLKTWSIAPALFAKQLPLSRRRRSAGVATWQNPPLSLYSLALRALARSPPPPLLVTQQEREDHTKSTVNAPAEERLAPGGRAACRERCDGEEFGKADLSNAVAARLVTQREHEDRRYRRRAAAAHQMPNEPKRDPSPTSAGSLGTRRYNAFLRRADFVRAHQEHEEWAGRVLLRRQHHIPHAQERPTNPWDVMRARFAARIGLHVRQKYVLLATGASSAVLSGLTLSPHSYRRHRAQYIGTTFLACRSSPRTLHLTNALLWTKDACLPWATGHTMETFSILPQMHGDSAGNTHEAFAELRAALMAFPDFAELVREWFAPSSKDSICTLPKRLGPPDRERIGRAGSSGDVIDLA